MTREPCRAESEAPRPIGEAQVTTRRRRCEGARDAQRLLDCDPLNGNKPQARERRR